MPGPWLGERPTSGVGIFVSEVVSAPRRDLDVGLVFILQRLLEQVLLVLHVWLARQQLTPAAHRQPAGAVQLRAYDIITFRMPIQQRLRGLVELRLLFGGLRRLRDVVEP